MATRARGADAASPHKAQLAWISDSPRVVVVALAIGGAWLIAVLAQLTGNAGALHHHALIEGGPPLWVALPLFLVAWQVMIAAMMLPASLPAVGVFSSPSRTRSRPRRALIAFFGAYGVVWTVFGVA